MKFRDITLTATTLAAAAALAAPAHAVTFADYGANNSNANMTFSDTSTGVALTASAQTLFDFLTLGAGYRDLSATYTFSATSTDAPVQAGGLDIQTGLGGSFAFTYAGPATAKLTPGENLLSGTFSGASLSGQDFGSAGSVVDSIFGGGDVAYASDILAFDPTSDESLSLALTSVLPNLHIVGGKLAGFNGVSTGNFAAGVLGAGGGGGVPEPASWALMLIGFAGVGVARRASLAAQRKALA